MDWKFGGVRIYVQKASGRSGQILARLQPVSSGTVIHAFGYESLIRNVNALVVGDTNNDSLFDKSQNSGTSYTLTSPEGSLGSFILKSYTYNRTNSTCQTIDTTQPTDAPVYEVDMELQRED